MHVDTTAVNEHGDVRQADIVSTVKDAKGRVVGTGTTRTPLGPEPRTSGVDIMITNPKLWSVDDPYLYTVDTRVLVGGRQVDATSTRMGIRWFAFDPDRGFSLK